MIRILLDCDGVIADFTSEALKVINKKLDKKGNEKFTVEHITQWDICSAIGHPHLWDDLKKASARKGFCKKIKPYPGSHEGVSALHALGEVFVVTSPLSAPTWMYEREQWLRTHFNIPKSNVVHAEQKHVVVGDFLIDDKIENISSWSKAHPNGIGLLWDMPYNRSTEIESSKIKRISTWQQAIDEIKLLKYADI